MKKDWSGSISDRVMWSFIGERVDFLSLEMDFSLHGQRIFWLPFLHTQGFTTLTGNYIW